MGVNADARICFYDFLNVFFTSLAQVALLACACVSNYASLCLLRIHIQEKRAQLHQKLKGNSLISPLLNLALKFNMCTSLTVEHSISL